eukprot:TRINITY_DN31612_c0_g1_i1.p1 TRINITY_DN31612_c0_g1~~TRINITY_DN31612_c0_g1_i1.p1  ORF type:complete len:171 (-),score=12.93 TRINITY_DN31612_c0_g1_i1:125-589(-)
MSFSKADRDAFHFTGSDDATAPDYVKHVPPRMQRNRSQPVAKSGRAPIPKMALRKDKPKYRNGAIAKEMFSSAGAFIMGESGPTKVSDHPLMNFQRPGSLKPTGRYRDYDGELAKITAIPYNRDNAVSERRIACKGNKAAHELNQGVGIFPSAE